MVGQESYPGKLNCYSKLPLKVECSCVIKSCESSAKMLLVGVVGNRELVEISRHKDDKEMILVKEDCP